MTAISASHHMSLVSFLLLRYWWFEKKQEPPYEVFGGQHAFIWDFTFSASMAFGAYGGAFGEHWEHDATEYVQRIVQFIETNNRAPRGEDMKAFIEAIAAKRNQETQSSAKGETPS